METRLKERLTGAAILVALIVMLVPEMFRGEGDHDGPSGATATPGSSSAEGPPLRSFTIDLTNNPKSAPLQSNGDVTPPTDAPAPVTPTPTPAAPAPIPPIPPTPVAPATPAHSAPPASSGAVASAPRPASTAGNPASSNWSVQLGLFAKRENAERLANELKAKGMTVAITGADAKGLFHVRTAGTSDRASAQALAQRLKGEGFQAAIVAP